MASASPAKGRERRSAKSSYVHLAPGDNKEYVEITIGATPQAADCLLGPLTAFPDGTYFFDRWPTRLEHPDWRSFRDPDRLWFRPYAAELDERATNFGDAWRAAVHTDALEYIDQSWLEALHYLAALRYQEFGAAQVWQLAQTMSASETVANCCLEQAGSRFFNSHTLNRFALDLTETLAGWDDDNAKDLWVADPMLSGARELIETEFLLRDWGEITVADTLVAVPLYYEPILRFFAVTAGRHGDSVTPVVAGGMLAQAEREYRWARELVRVALEVDANRPIIEEWLERWVPLARAAHSRLAPLYQQVGAGSLRYDAEQTRATGRAAATLTELGLSTASVKSDEAVQGATT